MAGELWIDALARSMAAGIDRRTALRLGAVLLTAWLARPTTVSAKTPKCGPDQVPSGDTCVCRNPSLTACKKACVNTQNDPQNCGACKHKCKKGSACVAGVCASPCDSTHPCERGCCNAGTCAPGTKSDACGANGTVCTTCFDDAGEVCFSGACRQLCSVSTPDCPVGECCADGAPTVCTSNTAPGVCGNHPICLFCSAPQVCGGNSCCTPAQNGCSSDGECCPGLLCQGGVSKKCQPCLAQGEACDANHRCCSGLTCVAGQFGGTCQ